MTTDSPILDAVRRDFGWFEEHLPHRHAAPQAPAQQPATMKAATAAAQQEDTMSLATLEADFGNRIAAVEAAVHNEIGKLVADLPAITADAKKLAGNPFAEVALKAADHIAAGILPVDAIAKVAGSAMTWLDDLVALYGPPQGAQQAPAAPPAQ